MGQKRKDVSALTLLHLWYRTYQLAFGLGARLLPWRRPEAVTGAGSFRRLPDLLQKYGARRPLVVGQPPPVRRPCLPAGAGTGWRAMPSIPA